MSIKLVMPPNHLILCRHPLLAAFNISQHQGLFQWVSYLHQVAKYWHFSFSISPSNKYSGQISFRIGWFDLLAVQGALNSLLTTPQFQRINSSALNFIVQLSHPYMTGKAIALATWTFVGKVMSLLFNMLSGVVIAFLPRKKRLLTSWLQSPSAVILEPQKIKCLFPLFPHLFAMKWWDRMPWS